MKISTPLSLCLLLLPAQLFAADFNGVFELEGQYSNRRHTAATVTIVQASSGDYLVTRRGKYTSQRHANKPAFVWQSTDVTVQGSKMTVIYSLDEADAGVIGRLRATTSTRTIAERLNAGNQLKAVYFLRNAGKSLREVIVNRTKKRPEHWWSYLGTEGDRKVLPQPTGGSTGGTLSPFAKKAFKAINTAVQAMVEDHYETWLGFADTPDEEADLRADREEDRQIHFGSLDQVNPDIVLSDNLDWRYQNGDPVKNAAGQVVPRDELEIWKIELAGEFTHFEEHSWTFVFDRRTGEVLISQEPEDL